MLTTDATSLLAIVIVAVASPIWQRGSAAGVSAIVIV